MNRRSVIGTLVLFGLSVAAVLPAVAAEVATANAAAADWASSVTLPEGEQAVSLFNGKDLTGWRERPDDYYSVVDGTIHATNKDAVPMSTYLFTDGEYRNFRVLMEVKQTMGKEYSTMHSALAVNGQIVSNGDADPFGHRGPIFMFCHDWGIWGADGRGRVYPPGQRGPIQRPKYEKIGEWNQLEMLVVGNRMRVVANGMLVVDYTEEDPKRLRKGPLGLQLHNNKRPQEWHFRGLYVVEDPQDELVTLSK